MKGYEQDGKRARPTRLGTAKTQAARNPSLRELIARKDV